MNNRERIARGMEITRPVLIQYAERELKQKYGPNWVDEVSRNLGLKLKDGKPVWDTPAILRGFTENWQAVFRFILGNYERSLIGELREIRNRWAHEEPFNSDDTYRALDTMQRTLSSLQAPTQADEVGKLKLELQRSVFDEQARNKTRYQLKLEGMPKGGLKPWREIVTPHPDVASGRYMQAEFAADLAQVSRNEGGDEYRDPVEFYRRTFITAGLRDLLVGALQRLSGRGTDPVVELQTNFGGGKTHSMLALFHLFGDTDSTKLPGLEPVLKEAKVEKAPTAKRAVLVGTSLSPGEILQKPDGTLVRTMWGELAWQLGGPAGYALVADSDLRGVSPGAQLLTELFRRYAPCLILIDEWVAYARQTVGKRDLPSGDFEAQVTFAQAITEAAKNAERALVVASIPASRIEVGGENGELALGMLKNVFERVGKPWRPATGDEGFEIVRRRLFEPIKENDAYVYRDAVVQSFAKMYREHQAEFPSGCSEKAYERELEAAYPIHPELFRRLYDDWSTLDKFQRTRGVLRLLAKVIHRLWEGQDAGLMILPFSVAMDDGAVKSELTRYLEDVWEPIISQDIDGENSLPLEIDRANPTLGRLSACRRVTRTLYIGTAPGAENKNPGIDNRRVRLGCVQPGETIATFTDALRRVSDKAKYIHQDGNRYWVSTKPNLNRMAEDRASNFRRESETLYAEIARRLMVEQKARGDFAAVHPCPETPGDVPDDPEARLVILPPQFTHRKGQTESSALKTAQQFLEFKGSGPRLERNTLVFLAADERERDALLDGVAQFLAWKSIDDENEALNLDAFQRNQCRTKRIDSDKTVDLRIAATWIHVLVPTQPTPTEPIVWDEIKVTGDSGLAQRTSSKLKQEEVLITEMGGIPLQMALNRYLWTDKDHVSVGLLTQWFFRYLYLPRVKNAAVLVEAVKNGVAQMYLDETFAIASGYDEAQKRYIGLTYTKSSAVFVDRSTLVVKSTVAKRQIEAETRQQPDPEVVEPSAKEVIHQSGPGKSHNASPGRTELAVQAPPRPPTVFIGSVRLNDQRIGRDAGRIAEEVIQHLSTLPGAEVEVTMEIKVHVPGGIKEQVMRTVTENCNTLKIQHTFERD